MESAHQDLSPPRGDHSAIGLHFVEGGGFSLTSPHVDGTPVSPVDNAVDDEVHSSALHSSGPGADAADTDQADTPLRRRYLRSIEPGIVTRETIAPALEPSTPSPLSTNVTVMIVAQDLTTPLRNPVNPVSPYPETFRMTLQFSPTNTKPPLASTPLRARLHSDSAQPSPALRVPLGEAPLISKNLANLDAAVDNAVGDMRPRDGWWSFFRRLHIRAVLSLTLGCYWTHQVRCDIRWSLSFRPHGFVAKEDWAKKVRASRTFFYALHRYCGLLWAWIRMREHHYATAPRKLRKWALFCLQCMRQRKSSPYWNIAAHKEKWHPRPHTDSLYYGGTLVSQFCPHCKEDTTVMMWLSDAWLKAGGEPSMRQTEYGSDASSVRSSNSSKCVRPQDVMTGADSDDSCESGCELEFDFLDHEAFMYESDPANSVRG
jgi:hypothetical protein